MSFLTIATRNEEERMHCGAITLGLTCISMLQNLAFSPCKNDIGADTLTPFP